MTPNLLYSGNGLATQIVVPWKHALIDFDGIFLMCKNNQRSSKLPVQYFNEINETPQLLKVIHREECHNRKLPVQYFNEIHETPQLLKVIEECHNRKLAKLTSICAKS